MPGKSNLTIASWCNTDLYVPPGASSPWLDSHKVTKSCVISNCLASLPFTNTQSLPKVVVEFWYSKECCHNQFHHPPYPSSLSSCFPLPLSHNQGRVVLAPLGRDGRQSVREPQDVLEVMPVCWQSVHHTANMHNMLPAESL